MSEAIGRSDDAGPAVGGGRLGGTRLGGLAADHASYAGGRMALPIRAAAEWPRGRAAAARSAASLLNRSEVGVSQRSIGVLQLDARRVRRGWKASPYAREGSSRGVPVSVQIPAPEAVIPPAR